MFPCFLFPFPRDPVLSFRSLFPAGFFKSVVDIETAIVVVAVVGVAVAGGGGGVGGGEEEEEHTLAAAAAGEERTNPQRETLEVLIRRQCAYRLQKNISRVEEMGTDDTRERRSKNTNE